jgi:hypothetical protein
MNTIRPWYTRPENYSYLDYFSSIQHYNSVLSRNTSEFLINCFGLSSQHFQLEKVLVTTTGSDGRMEKGPESPMELVLYSLQPKEFIVDILERVGENSCSLLDKNIFQPSETRTIDTETLSFYNNDPKSVYPTRVLDARVICGNESLLKPVYMKLLNELIGPDSKGIFQSMKEKRRIAKRISNSGEQVFKGVKLNHYDLLEGAAFYNPDTGQSSFKQGPMRLVQFSVAYSLMKHLREHNSMAILDELPHDTPTRLLFLHDNKVNGFASLEVSEVIDTYKYFLHQYHMSQSQYKFESNNRTCFDATEVRERLTGLTAVISTLSK